VIADGSQIPSQTTTTAIDGDTSSTNYVLLNGTYNYNGANPTAYLPSDGYFISAQTPDLPYQLAPANQNNSLRLESGQSGALTFATPTAAKSVYVLATSGGGSSQINVTVHFDDNTTQEFTNYTILDWYSGSANYAIQGIGRVQRDGNDLTAVTIRLFEKQFVLSVANQAKNIVSVSFQRTGGGGIANIMGISIENSIISTCAASTTWTGTWSNGEPDATTKAIIDGALTLTSDLTACELEVTENGSLTIPANKTFTVKGQVINQATSDDFVIKSDGILLQTDEVENQRAITVERASSPMYRLDYTIWSSPVSEMLLRDFSNVSVSGGSGTLWNRVYTLGDNAWNQVWASQQIFEADYTTTFDKAKGYMYRAKNNWVTRDSGNPGESDLGVFTGVPNNGTISINTPLMFNAIGNPYPSPIDGDELLGTGVSGLYFWTNANVPDTNGNYQLNNWAYYTQAEGTGVQIGGIGDQIQAPNVIIQPGQGFVIGTTEDANEITFTNEMRMGNNGMFFRQMSHERHRFWLNLSDEMAVYNQILVGYMENATQGADSGIDAKMFGYEG